MNAFTTACYDMNSITELEECLMGEADEVDMAIWGITASEWRDSIEGALSERKGS